MNDGQTVFWNGGVANKSWNVGQILSKIYDNNKSKQAIVVAIHPIDRNREYTHSHWMWKQTYGAVDDYNNYIVKYVKPWIDRNYRTLSTVKHTVIAGSSLGGLAAFHMALSHPSVFGIAICMSPSFWAGLDFLPLPIMTKYFKSLETSDLIRKYNDVLQSNHVPILYIDWGLTTAWEIHNSLVERLAASRSNEMVDLLTQKYGFKQMAVESVQQINDNEKILLTCIDPYGGHDEIWWDKRLFTIVNVLFDHIWKFQ
ncbi:unnamed protein product [Rotaria sp. Silwood1]|nr:unnamed protein product [Rotaria sp. Silwood1]CAF1462280.1 unnamed protein product [Rotaria sp. Silwood1]CAF4674259.1 unnamed protein product [Rotaria sp. Silwood1]